MANLQGNVRDQTELKLSIFEVYAILRAMLEKGIGIQVQMSTKYMNDYQLEEKSTVNMGIENVDFGDGLLLELFSSGGYLKYSMGYSDKEFTLYNFSSDNIHSRNCIFDFDFYTLSMKSQNISFYFYVGNMGTAEIKDIFLNIDGWVRKYMNEGRYNYIDLIGIDLEKINYTKIVSYGGILMDKYTEAEAYIE